MTTAEQIADEVVDTVCKRRLYLSAETLKVLKGVVSETIAPFVHEGQGTLQFDPTDKAYSEQRQAILALLKARRSKGAEGWELAEIALQYNARVYELRHYENYKIEKVHLGGRNYKYVLAPEHW